MTNQKKEKWLLFFLLIYIGILVFEKIFDFDVFWILNTGKWVFKNHQILNSDIFTYTNLGKPLYNQNWLFGLLIFVFYNYMGFFGLLFFKVIIAVLIGIILFNSCKLLSPRLNIWVTAFLFLFGFLFITNSFFERPQILSILMITIYIYFINIAKYKAKYGLLYYLPILQVIWINCHLMAYWGILLLAVALLDTIVKEIFTMGIKVQAVDFIKKLFSNREFSVLTAVLFCVIGANVLNPLGINIFNEFYKFYSSKDVLIDIVEWTKPLILSTSPLDSIFQTYVYIGTLLLLLTAFIKRVSFFNVFMVILGIYHFFSALRFLNLLYVLTIPVFYCLVIYAIDWFLGIAKFSDLYKSKRLGIIFKGLFIVLLSLNFYFWKVTNIFWGYGIKEKSSPIASINYLKSLNIKGRVLNYFPWGGMISFYLYPNVMVFMDGRQIILFDKEFLWLETNYSRGFVSLTKIYEKYPYDMVLLITEGLNVDPSFYDDWAVVMVEENAVLFLDRKKYPDIVSKYDITGLDIKNAAISESVSEKKAEEIKKRLEKLIVIAPRNSFLYMCLSNIYSDEKNYSKALEYINIAEDLQKKKLITDTALVIKADILSKTGNYKEAIYCYRHLMEMFPSDIRFKEAISKLYEKAGLNEDAFKFTKKYVDEFSEIPKVEGYDRLARIYYFDKNEPLKAIDMYNRAEMLTGREELLKLIYYNRGNIYYDNLDFKDALKDFDRYLLIEGIDKDSETVYKTGLLYMRTGKKDLAIKLYDNYLKVNKTPNDKWSNLIKIYMENEK